MYCLKRSRTYICVVLTHYAHCITQEKFNVWVAWLNLEAAYGDPAEDALLALFRRALPYCDAKKLHFALLGAPVPCAATLQCQEAASAWLGAPGVFVGVCCLEHVSALV